MRTDNTLRVLRLTDHNQQFEVSQHKSGQSVSILNHIDLTGIDYVEKLCDLIFADGSGIDFIAKCQCGYLEGNKKIGVTCPVCDTKVGHNHLLDEDNLVCKNWLACPKELPNGWLSPKVYLNLANWLSYDKGKRNYLDDILDIEAQIPYGISDVVTGQGFQYLYDNFDRLIDYFAHQHPEVSKKPDTLPMLRFLSLFKDRIFCHYLPVLNSAIAPVISSDNGGASKRRYSEQTANNVISAAITLSVLEYSPKKRDRQLEVERSTFKAYKDFIGYVDVATKTYISQKKAIPRMHIFGCRLHWSFRAVVVPIVEAHKPHELHAPWKLMVNMLRVHLIGILCGPRYSLPLNDAVAKVRFALQVYDADIHAIINKLIDDTPFAGLPVVWDRPPSIRDGSVMLKFITKVKVDVDDNTMGIGVIDAALPNVDKR